MSTTWTDTPAHSTSWTATSGSTISWLAVGSETTWDSGATHWDLTTNIEETTWDAIPNTVWT